MGGFGRRGVGWLAALGVGALLVACGGDAISDAPARAVEEQQSVGAGQAEVVEASRVEVAEDGAGRERQAGAQQAGAGQAGGQQGAGSRAADDEEGRRVAPRRWTGGGVVVGPTALDHGYTLEMLRALAEGIGARFNGEPGEREAVEFLAERLRADGYEVAIEGFEFVARGGVHTIRVTRRLRGGGETSTSLQALLMEGSRDVPVSGPIVLVPGVGSREDFASVEAAGAVAVVGRGELTFSEKQGNAAAAGAAALVVVDETLPIYVGVLREAGEIPVYGVGGGSGELLLESDGGTATIGASGGEVLSSWNVAARRADGVCRVVVGGHYDSVVNVPGANDNASGTATVLSLARSWAEADSAEDVCFVGFGAEELGLHGSEAFVAAARESGELEEITAMLNLDAFGNGERPILAVGDGDLAAVLTGLGEQLGITVEMWDEPRGFRSDYVPFERAGAAVIFPAVRGRILHVPADNVGNIDEALLRDVGLLAHAMLECLLERAGSRIEPRLSCDAEAS